MPKHLSHLSVETLANGFIRVFDRRAGWAALFNSDGSYRNGAPASREYREAAELHLFRQRYLSA